MEAAVNVIETGGLDLGRRLGSVASASASEGQTNGRAAITRFFTEPS